VEISLLLICLLVVLLVQQPVRVGISWVFGILLFILLSGWPYRMVFRCCLLILVLLVPLMESPMVDPLLWSFSVMSTIPLLNWSMSMSSLPVIILPMFTLPLPVIPTLVWLLLGLLAVFSTLAHVEEASIILVLSLVIWSLLITRPLLTIWAFAVLLLTQPVVQ